MKKVLLIFLCLSFSFSGCGQNDEPEPNPDWGTGGNTKSKLTVMSYNIRHCAPYYGTSETTVADVNNVAEVIKKIKPDVILLQEVDQCTKRSLGLDQAKELAKLAGYPYHYFFKQKDLETGSYGAAILSSFYMSEVENHALPKVIDGLTITGSNILGTAKIKFNETDIYLAVTHLSVTQAEKDRQFPIILKELSLKKESPVIVAGDFNSKPDNSIIKKLDEAGFIRTNTDPMKFTIPSNAPNRELDYIAYKPQKLFSVISHTVFTGISASDHLPIVSVLNVLKP